MSRPVLRHWCAECRYPDREPFLFGTVQADAELAAIAELTAPWSTISPHPAPAMIALPGLLAFEAEQERPASRSGTSQEVQ